jgi:hypothetical protein
MAMNKTYGSSDRVLRVRPKRLALCLSATLLSPMSVKLALAASPVAALPLLHARPGAMTPKSDPARPAVQPWTVQNCTDHNANSLRDIIENKAQSGDTVDLSQLPLLCNSTSSKITLTTGEIAIAQNNITLQGPDPADGSVTISGGAASRVLNHQGFGTLTVHSLTIAGGSYHVAGNALGGCVKSNSGIYLRSTLVTGCIASSDAGEAKGGGIYATGDVILVLSTVSGNQTSVGSQQSKNLGGGISTFGNLIANYSSISDNVVQGEGGGAGGAYANKVITIFASTIDNNTASSWSAAVSRGSMALFNSTVSRNLAAGGTYALYTDGDSLTISNSTIAFNHSNLPGGAAVRFQGSSANNPLTLQSSIIANNTAGLSNEPADLFMASGHGILSGADNLVIASNVSDPNVITATADPRLGPLQFNGGRTRTHTLLPGSPAMGMGNHTGLPPWITNDQRGPGYPRTTGPAAKVDMGAFQLDTIFATGFDFQ